jgi:hypothetical protein
MIEISILLNIKLSFEDEISIVNISEKIRSLELDKRVLNEFIIKYDDMVTTELCGEKYKHNKKEYSHEIAGKSDRKIITLAGELDIKVNKIRDKKKQMKFPNQYYNY